MKYEEPTMEVMIFDDIFTRLGEGSVDYGTDLTSGEF